tara:strand:- start:255 stop:827 length:573 start_codon:yes stop_codon:yes gene_type:complete
MAIHSTHSRKELIDLIEIYQLQENNDYLHNYDQMSKHILSKLLWKSIQEMDTLIIKDNDLFFFESLEHLKEFISKPTPNRQVRGKDILWLHDKLRNLNYYINHCGYLVSQSNYSCLDDVIKDINFVKEYGSLPAVRRIVRLINNDVKIKVQFECNLSERQRKALQIKEQIKKQTSPQFKVKKGTHTIIFG